MAQTMVDSGTGGPKANKNSNNNRRQAGARQDEKKAASTAAASGKKKPYKHPTNGLPICYWPYSPMNAEYFFASPMADFFYSIGWSPNHVTCVNLVFRVWIIYMMAFNADYLGLLLFCTALTQTLDCVDGVMARRFNMCSAFGQMLDISCDVFFGGAQAVIMCYQGMYVHGLVALTGSMLVAQVFVCHCTTANATKERSKPLAERSFVAQTGQLLEEYMMVNLLTFQYVNYCFRS